MYRVCELSGQWYAKEIESVEDAADDITIFANEGTPVVIVRDLEDLTLFGLKRNEVTVVE